MAQVKIYGLKESIQKIKNQLSDVVHYCIVEALKFPKDKRFHRFFIMDREDMIFPDYKTTSYTIIEITLMSGRSVEAKKRLIKMLFKELEKELSITPNDLEVVILEVPPANFGFRGMCGDEIELNYKIEV